MVGGKLSNVVSVVTDVFSKLFEWVDKYGLLKMIEGLFFLVMTSLCVVFMSAAYRRSIAEAAQYTQNDTHLLGTEVRYDVSAKINNKLLKMAHSLNADRGFVFEMHNGKENPTNLPFNYCDMTYEEIDETHHSVQYINESYENVNMGKYSFPFYLSEHYYFIGDIHSFSEIDKKMGNRFLDDDINYIALIMIKTEKAIGFLGFTFSEEPEMSTEMIHGKIGSYVQEIALLLDFGKQREVYQNQKRNVLR